MNKIIEWFTPKPTETMYVWQNVNDSLPTEEMRYLVVRRNHGKLGMIHFDLFCPERGWLQVAGSHVGQVALWMKTPEIPKNEILR